jgi:hypothetical protein
MKTFIFLMSIATITSCTNKLPDNIISAISSCEIKSRLASENDSIIISLTTKDIDQLSMDSIVSLTGIADFHRANYDTSSRELDRILTESPQYKKFDEVKKMEQPYYYKDSAKYKKNISYLDKQFIVLLNK